MKYKFTYPFLLLFSLMLFGANSTYAMPGWGGGSCDAANPAGVDNICPDPCNPCGGACGWETAPAVQDVVDNCNSWEYDPVLDGCWETTNCFQFEAVNTTVSFGVIINSTCTNGNVTYMEWSLYDNCSGAAIQTGDLSDLTFENLDIGTVYTYCYTIQVPSGCYHTLHYPYFVGASETFLSNEEIVANIVPTEDANTISWSVFDVNCSHYIVQRKNETSDWKDVTKINASSSSKYNYQDKSFDEGYNYYRIKQVYQSGFEGFSDVLVVENKRAVKKVVRMYNLHGQEVDENYKGFVIKTFADGTAKKAFNK